MMAKLRMQTHTPDIPEGTNFCRLAFNRNILGTDEVDNEMMALEVYFLNSHQVSHLKIRKIFIILYTYNFLEFEKLVFRKQPKNLPLKYTH